MKTTYSSEILACRRHFFMMSCNLVFKISVVRGKELTKENQCVRYGRKYQVEFIMMLIPHLLGSSHWVPGHWNSDSECYGRLGF